jgi:hypothetical protein
MYNVKEYIDQIMKDSERINRLVPQIAKTPAIMTYQIHITDQGPFQ